ncbi:hypothetical protein [Pseudomonas sp.]|uniref:hypothetical protein n=1 Tax=Pseudomonas sp. TaxID=306 RepID=UPI00258B63EB|nr:hypothetical protein [Pseudomonas sp.]
MAEYECTLIYDASHGCTVEADNLKDAIDAAYDRADASLCHQCSARLDLGDVQGVIVYQDGAEVSDTTYSGEEIARLLTEKTELLEALDVLVTAMDESRVPSGGWVVALSNARGAIAKARGN